MKYNGYKRKPSSGEKGIGFSTVILIIFVVLKVTGNIDWSWWWVISPAWIAGGIAVIMVGVLLSLEIASRQHPLIIRKIRNLFLIMLVYELSIFVFLFLFA